MKTVTASDANRQFSTLLREVGQGESFVVLCRGKAVATILPAHPEADQRQSAKRELLERLRQQRVLGARDWTRGELYES
jgi:antitoxin (DNA-binding transcriptional repressor) of toxin-antitoxin stability system